MTAGSPTTDPPPSGPSDQRGADAAAAEPVLLTEPADGLPEVVTTPDGLAAAAAALAGGHGPLAVDTERAHGFRYSTRAYLIQLRREGAGTHLIDPIAFQPDGYDAHGADAPTADLTPLADTLADVEWILHAASQDLPCLVADGMVPHLLFDTELAGRLLGFPRVALGTLLEEIVGVRLLKEHSAADWSTRPLPTEWLNYAALDVEKLIALRDALAERLADAGKDEWARQEFAALVSGAADPPVVRDDPWRRTSGIHKVRTRGGLALVRELWQVRDRIARDQDRAPGRVLQDAAIIQLAEQVRENSWPDRSALHRVSGFRRRAARAHEREWMQALHAAERLSPKQWPPRHVGSGGPPSVRSWQSRYPEAAARLDRSKQAVRRVAVEVNVPPENLLAPDTVRRLAWQPPQPATEEATGEALTGHGARPWQVELCAGPLADAMRG